MTLVKTDIRTLFKDFAAVFLILAGLTSYSVKGCVIMGRDSGYCENKFLAKTYISETIGERSARKIAEKNWDCEDESCMPFCGRFIAAYYPFCAPIPNNMLNHTIRSKDSWIEEQVTSTIAKNILIETQSGAKKHFHKNKACQDAFKRYACWLNFPKCG